MTAAKQLGPRPWYCIDALTDEYAAVIRAGGDVSMQTPLRIIRGIVVNIAMLFLASYSLWLGADPTIVGTLAVFALATYNGAEIVDYQALARAYLEASDEEERK